MKRTGYVIVAKDEDLSEEVMYWVCNKHGTDNYSTDIEDATIFRFAAAAKSTIEDIYTRQDMDHVYIDIEI